MKESEWQLDCTQKKYSLLRNVCTIGNKCSGCINKKISDRQTLEKSSNLELQESSDELLPSELPFLVLHLKNCVH